MASSGGGPAVAQSLQPAFLVNPQHKCDPVKQVTFKASHSRKVWEGGSDRVSRGELSVPRANTYAHPAVSVPEGGSIAQWRLACPVLAGSSQATVG